MQRYTIYYYPPKLDNVVKRHDSNVVEDIVLAREKKPEENPSGISEVYFELHPVLQFETLQSFKMFGVSCYQYHLIT